MYLYDDKCGGNIGSFNQEWKYGQICYICNIVMLALVIWIKWPEETNICYKKTILLEFEV